MPALFDLACIGCMHSNRFDVLGTGRTQLQEDQFRDRMRLAVSSGKHARPFNEDRWQTFSRRLHYLIGDPNEAAFYPKLAAKLDEMQQQGASANHLFYVSTPASLAAPIVQNLGASGLSRNARGWSRIVLEKPFGSDLESARELNQVVSAAFDERDVYRIDHYLGKETVQNILVFRFGNLMFEPVWNRNYIDYVEITAAETLGVEGRASFYEETGALRDMVANHLLQLLTMTAMEPPVSFDADAVREQKVQVLRSMRPMTIEEVAERTVRGQYGLGMIAGVPVRGYREEPGVYGDSLTDTYAAIKFHIDNWRWAGVPFYVRTGKRLSRSMTEVAVHFKQTPQALFAHTAEDQLGSNRIVMRIQPDEGISIAFGAKRPGPQMQAITVQADFSYQTAFRATGPAAYETLLLDAMRGDATLFTRNDEVEAEWRIITPIEEAWAQLPGPQFPNYVAGSEGPEDAAALLDRDLHHWRRIAEPETQNEVVAWPEAV
jgi:glucose-6-phosphate 1-dehydrogenase